MAVVSIAATSDPAAGSVRPKQPELLALRHRRQVALLLLLGAELEQRQRVQADVHRDQRAECRLAALDLLADQRLGDVVEPGAAVLGRDHRPQQAQLGHPLDDAHVEVVVDVVLLRDRQDATIDELAHGLLDRALLVGQIEIHRGAPSLPDRRNAIADPTPEGGPCRVRPERGGCCALAAYIAAVGRAEERSVDPRRLRGRRRRRSWRRGPPAAGRAWTPSRSRTRSTTVCASSAPASGSSRANSSPPMRKTPSTSRRPSASSSANPSSAASPARCPRAVVQLLEPVQVADDQRERPAVAHVARGLGRQPLAEHPPVEQPRQRVVVGQEPHLLELGGGVERRRSPGWRTRAAPGACRGTGHQPVAAGRRPRSRRSASPARSHSGTNSQWSVHALRAAPAHLRVVLPVPLVDPRPPPARATAGSSPRSRTRCSISGAQLGQRHLAGHRRVVRSQPQPPRGRPGGRCRGRAGRSRDLLEAERALDAVADRLAGSSRSRTSR